MKKLETAESKTALEKANKAAFKKAAGRKDIEKIAALAEAIWPECYMGICEIAHIKYMLDNFQSYDAIKEQINNGCDYYLITFGDADAGYFAVKQEQDHTFLSKYYILKQFRGQGIGKSSMSFIESISLHKLRLHVNRRNPSIEIYKKLGFSIYDEKATDIGSGYVMDDYFMEKTL